MLFLLGKQFASQTCLSYNCEQPLVIKGTPLLKNTEQPIDKAHWNQTLQNGYFWYGDMSNLQEDCVKDT